MVGGGPGGRQRQGCPRSRAGPRPCSAGRQEGRGAARPSEGVRHPAWFSFSPFPLVSCPAKRVLIPRPALGCPALGDGISRHICSGFSPAGEEDLLAGGGLRALAGLALASSNGDEWREYAGARAGKFLLQAGPHTAVLRDPAWGGGCFWPTLSPGRSVGQQRPPWASCNPHRQAKATPKQNSKHRRCHLHPHREQLPTECLSGGSAFCGGTCV